MSTDPLFMKIGSEYYWYHNDHLGTPQMVTTSSGAVVWKAKYNSFGKATVDPSSTVISPLRLPGQYEDAETGLHYNFYRYFDIKIGRYLREDPNGLDGGLNLYAYVQNNPVVWYDPWGLEQIMIFYATDLKKKSFNDRMLHHMVDPPDKIEQAAKDANKTYKIDKTATKSEIIAAYEASDTERIIIVAHGADGQPYIVDVNEIGIRPSDFDINKKGKNLTNIDMLSCHQYKYESSWEQALDVDVDPHDQEGYMWWYEINRALNEDIPDCIK